MKRIDTFDCIKFLRCLSDDNRQHKQSLNTSDRFGGMTGSIYSQRSSPCFSVTPPFFFFLSALAHLQLLFLVSEMVHLSPNPPEAWMTQISPSQTNQSKEATPTFHNPFCHLLPFSSEHFLLSESNVSVGLFTCSLIPLRCALHERLDPSYCQLYPQHLPPCVEYNRCSIHIC